jgi:hypothetical protein
MTGRHGSPELAGLEQLGFVEEPHSAGLAAVELAGPEHVVDAVDAHPEAFRNFSHCQFHDTSMGRVTQLCHEHGSGVGS